MQVTDGVDPRLTVVDVASDRHTSYPLEEDVSEDIVEPSETSEPEEPLMELSDDDEDESRPLRPPLFIEGKEPSILRSNNEIVVLSNEFGVYQYILRETIQYFYSTKGRVFPGKFGSFWVVDPNGDTHYVSSGVYLLDVVDIQGDCVYELEGF